MNNTFGLCVGAMDKEAPNVRVASHQGSKELFTLSELYLTAFDG